MSLSFLQEPCAGLAPMAGCTDSAFRAVCRELGAGFTVSEMVSAKALSLGDRKSPRLMQFRPCERPFGIQLFGCEPNSFPAAVGAAAALRPDFIDLNMGCPAPKIEGSGSGSALMRRPELAAELVHTAVRNAGGLPVTVKLRAGFDEVNCIDFAVMLEQAGVSAITLHPRTRAQMFRGHSDWQLIAGVRRAVSVPVIGNGDIASGGDALRMLRETGCDAVMVGRSALGDPFIFAEISAALAGRPYTPPDTEQRMALLYRQISDMCAQKGEARALPEARKHVMWSVAGFRGAALFRRRAAALNSLDELKELIEEILAASADDGVPDGSSCP